MARVKNISNNEIKLITPSSPTGYSVVSSNTLREIRWDSTCQSVLLGNKVVHLDTAKDASKFLLGGRFSVGYYRVIYDGESFYYYLTNENKKVAINELGKCKNT